MTDLDDGLLRQLLTDAATAAPAISVSLDGVRARQRRTCTRWWAASSACAAAVVVVVALTASLGTGPASPRPAASANPTPIVPPTTEQRVVGKTWWVTEISTDGKIWQAPSGVANFQFVPDGTWTAKDNRNEYSGKVAFGAGVLTISDREVTLLPLDDLAWHFHDAFEALVATDRVEASGSSLTLTAGTVRVTFSSEVAASPTGPPTAAKLCSAAPGLPGTASLTTVGEIRNVVFGSPGVGAVHRWADAFQGALVSDPAAWCWRRAAQGSGIVVWAAHLGSKPVRMISFDYPVTSDHPLPSGVPNFIK